MDKSFTSYLIEERSYVAYIKREIHREVSGLGFSESRTGEVDIIVSELASNLIKHASGGEFLYRTFRVEDASVIEILCIDQGPGMSDPARMMKDGVSTTATLGQGLGAISRLSDSFQIYSLPKWGTVVHVTASSRKERDFKRSQADIEVRALCVNKPKETVSGDAYSLKRTDSSIQIFLGDGLGHGQHAHTAVSHAIAAFQSCTDEEPQEVVRYIHEKVRRTRGLVASIASFDLKSRTWRICAVGNIMTRLYSGITFRNYLSYNGTVGMNIPNTLHDSVFEGGKNQYLIMISDGIRSRYELTRYPSILKYDGMILAGAIYKDYSRRTDDASVVIARLS